VRRARSVIGLAILVSGLAGAGCTPQEGTVTVLAAASLSAVLPQVETLLESQDPTTDIEVAYAGSSTIVQQVNAGADADAVLLAAEELVDDLDPELVSRDPVLVAANTLAVVVPADNPAELTSLADLGRDDITLVLCAEQVPCGRSAAQMLNRAGITPTVASYEPDVVATLRRVSAGEADAGVVYVTDARGEPSVTTLDVPGAVNVTTRYPALALGDGPAGEELVDALVSAEVQRIFAEAGFAAP
jgi:molybdate transport system substrate-binding protein